jgi:hypothetical protein
MTRTQGETVTAPKSQPQNPPPMDGVKTVEIKVTIRPDEELKAIRALALHENSAQVRDIYFYDTPKLKLYKAGLVLRARRVDDAKDDSTVKFRPVEMGMITKRWRRLQGFKMEADCVGKKEICSASLTVPQDRAEIDKVAKGTRSIRQLFSQEQEDFIKKFYREINFDELCALGPIGVLRWQSEQEKFPYELTVEEWRLPDCEVLVEVSIKTPLEAKARACKDFDKYLRGLGLDPKGAQETKTRTAMKYFAKAGRKGNQ